jgi:RimJ/RimL family protein N-acetyltransferase
VVTLRTWTADDVPDIVAACRDPEIPRWTQVPEGYTEEHARMWLATHAEGMTSGRLLPLAIADAKSGRLLGAIGLHWGRDRVAAEVGYWVAPWARRRGVASRALRLLSAWGIEHMTLARLQVRTHGENLASQCVARAAGYRAEGVLRSAVEFKGRRIDVAIFGLLPEDLDAADSGPPQRLMSPQEK